MNRLIIDCIRSAVFGPAATDAHKRLQALGDHLVALGSMALEDFEAFTRLEMLRTNSEFMALMEEHLRTKSDAPEYWAHDVRKYLEILRQSVTRDDYCLPLDLLDRRSASEARQLAQRVVLTFGRLLSWWPHMVEVARDLRARGQRMAKTV
jgi:hypothetical protein